MQQWVEEFLYRGRPPGSTEPPAYHVIVGQQVADPFDSSRVTQRFLGPMTPEAVQAMGLPVSALIAGINDGTLAQVDNLTAMLAERTQELSEATEQRDAAVKAASQLTAERNQLQTQSEEQQVEVAKLRGEVATQKGTISALQAQIAAMQSASSALVETPLAE